MLTSISPLGERARSHRWGLTATAYLLGSTAGGTAVGSLLGAAGSALTGPLPRVAAALLLACAGADLARWLPHGRRQVDEDWLTRYRGGVYGAGYGVQLGLGVVTVVSSASTYAVLALTLLSGSLIVSTAIGLTFGLARALPLLALRGVSTPPDLRRIASRIESARRFLAPVTASGLVIAAGALLVVG